MHITDHSHYILFHNSFVPVMFTLCNVYIVYKKQVGLWQWHNTCNVTFYFYIYLSSFQIWTELYNAQRLPIIQFLV